MHLLFKVEISVPLSVFLTTWFTLSHSVRSWSVHTELGPGICNIGGWLWDGSSFSVWNLLKCWFLLWPHKSQWKMVKKIPTERWDHVWFLSSLNLPYFGILLSFQSCDCFSCVSGCFWFIKTSFYVSCHIRNPIFSEES